MRINTPVIKNTCLFLLRSKLIKNIIRIILSVSSRVKCSTYTNFVQNLDKVIKHNQKFHDNESELFVLYPDVFPGVKHSTESLFRNVIPIKWNILYELTGCPDHICQKIINQLVAYNIQKIIISGGSSVLAYITKKMNIDNQAKSIEVFYLWHGSPAQWCDPHHLCHFKTWYDLYMQDKLRSIITLKYGLKESLESMQIRTNFLQNFIPQLKAPETNTKSNKFKVGLWSAYAVWIKNLYPQLFAMHSLGDNIELYTNFSHQESKWITKDLHLVQFPKSIKHNDLIKYITNTDLTLYITNTECSPLIALESLGAGVPCIVGPTSNLYADDKFLETMLTVNRVDCPYDIARAVKNVQENYKEIRQRIPEFVTKYNQKVQQLKSKLLIEIFQINN